MATRSNRKNKRKHKPANRQKPSTGKRKIPWFWLALLFVLVVAFLLSKLELDFTSKREKPAFVAPEKHFTLEGYLDFHKRKATVPFKSIGIEIAETDYERSLGLMFRYAMADTLGMLFIMERNEVQSFWMRNTYISLDILYVDADFKIVSQHKQVEALSDKSTVSKENAKYVVEVVGGFSDRFGVAVGDSISFRRIGKAVESLN